MAPPVAIVTGASSGIGLALTTHLLSKGWNVVMADLNKPTQDLAETLFVQTDITSWDQQAALFQRAHAWHGRLDFCALNAGTDDRDDIFHSPLTSPPRKPDMLTFDVNLIGVYYGIKLAAHYLSSPSTDAGKPKPGGKIVVTASSAALFPDIPVIPQYVASKAGALALVRALGHVAKSNANICINGLCPAFVATNLSPVKMVDTGGDGGGTRLTPMSTMLRSFDALADLDHVADEDWVEGGDSAQVIEGTREELIYHPMPRATYDDLSGEDTERWFGAYIERNTKFAAQDWSRT